MSGLVGENKHPAQYAAEDSKASTHSSADKDRAAQDAKRTEAEQKNDDAAGKDSNRRGASMKKMNKATYDKCMAKGMSKEDAEDIASTPWDDKDDKDEDPVKKALDAVADTIQKGTLLFTQADVDAINAEHADRTDRLVKSIDASTGKLRERVGQMEQAFLKLHELHSGMVDGFKGVTAEVGEMKKSIAAAPVAAAPVAEDPLTKAAPIAGDNKPVTEPVALTVVPSPLDDANPAAPGVDNATIIKTATEKLQKGDLSDLAVSELQDVLFKATALVPPQIILRDHGAVLGLKAA